MPSPKKLTSLFDEPHIYKGRSKFDLSHSSHFDFYHGQLVPVDTPMLVLPGDTFDLSQRTFIRMTQPLKVAPFDTLTCDVHYFFVPMRLLWDDWNDFITGNTGTSWNTVSSLAVPTLECKLIDNEASSDNARITVHSLLDYLGVPPHAEPYSSGSNSRTISINALPSRAYYEIYNWFYRYEPLAPEVYVYKGENPETISISMTLTTNGPRSNKLCRVAKLKDLFNRLLPQPQKGPEVALDLSLSDSIAQTLTARSSDQLKFLIKNDDGSTDKLQLATMYLNSGNISSNAVGAADIEDLSGVGGVADFVVSKGFANLLGSSVNKLREAFMLDKIRRIDAIYGQRINEFTRGHFGVTPPTIAYMPEYLGGETFDINVNQVIQTSDQGSGSSELGEVAGYSLTKHQAHYFTKSFTEYGYIMGLMCTRIKHNSYGQGLPGIFYKLDRFDYWLPEMSNLPDQPVYKRELFANNTGNFDEVLGYCERGMEYKTLVSRVSGLMRTQVQGTLSVWTYTTDFLTAPTLTANFMDEAINSIDRSLYLGYSVAPPFVAHIYFDTKAYRVMPYHSIPGGLTGSF